MKVATIDEEPRYDAPLGNFQLMSTPFSKVTDLWKGSSPVGLLFANDRGFSGTGWTFSWSEEMVKVYRLYVGLLAGKIVLLFRVCILTFFNQILL